MISVQTLTLQSLPELPCSPWLLSLLLAPVLCDLGLMQSLLSLSPGRMHWWAGEAVHYLALLSLTAFHTCTFQKNSWLQEHTTTSLGPSPRLFLSSARSAITSVLFPLPLSPVQDTHLSHIYPSSSTNAYSLPGLPEEAPYSRKPSIMLPGLLPLSHVILLFCYWLLVPIGR